MIERFVLPVDLLDEIARSAEQHSIPPERFATKVLSVGAVAVLTKLLSPIYEQGDDA